MLQVTVEDNFQQVAEKFQKAGDRALLEIDKEMAEIGARVAETAKEIAGEHSTKIPDTIELTVLPGAVEIRGGNNDVPTGALFELGNKDSKRSAKTFRHPVFGNRDVWVEQAKYPYLAPALRRNRPAIRKQMEAALAQALTAEGFEVL